MKNNLYVGNLPWSVTSEELEEMFAPFGAIQSARVITDRETGRSRGFGFVEMVSEEDAEAAIEALHESDCHGRNLVVNVARGRGAGGGRPGGGRRDGGGRWDGGGGRRNGGGRGDRWDDRW